MFSQNSTTYFSNNQLFRKGHFFIKRKEQKNFLDIITKALDFFSPIWRTRALKVQTIWFPKCKCKRQRQEFTVSINGWMLKSMYLHNSIYSNPCTKPTKYVFFSLRPSEWLCRSLKSWWDLLEKKKSIEG